MTDTEFDDILAEIMDENKASSLLSIPGVYEIVSEHFETYHGGQGPKDWPRREAPKRSESKFDLAVDTDNAVFDGDNLRSEVACLLREVARRLEQGEDATYYRSVLDVNGNVVGRFRLIGERGIAVY